MKRWLIGTLTPLATLIAAAGCSSKSYTDFSAFITEPRPLVSATNYRVMPPDRVLITSKRVREINGHAETVRPDGKLTLPLLGTVLVAGKTPEQLSAEIEARAQEYYDDADVSLRVTSYRSQKIFVFGEVAAPGPYPYTGANTILNTLARAQPSRLADPERIHVLRPGADGEIVHRMTVSLNKMVQEGDTTLNAVLEEGDIIYVPPTGFAAVGLAFQQLLLPITPAAAIVAGPSDMYSSYDSEPYRGSEDGTQ